MVKITKKRNYWEVKLTKPWENISIAGIIAGFLSGIARVIGVPIDKESQSMLFLKTFCEATDDDFQLKCLGIVSLISLISLIIAGWIIYDHARKIKDWKIRYNSKEGYPKEIQIPGVVKGFVLYGITFVLGFFIAFKLFT